VLMCIRWPGVIKPGTIINDMCAHEDLLPTFAAAAGEPDVVAKALNGYKAGDRTFKVHFDGHNLIPFFKSEEEESPRKEFLYWNDDGQLCAARVQNLKVAFLEQRNKGIAVWKEEFTNLRIPKVFNMRSDRSRLTSSSTSFRSRRSSRAGLRPSRDSRHSKHPRAST
jgi:arylsulfatase A-like enzyme